MKKIILFAAAVMLSASAFSQSSDECNVLKKGMHNYETCVENSTFGWGLGCSLFVESASIRLESAVQRVSGCKFLHGNQQL